MPKSETFFKRGEAHPNARLSEQQVVFIRKSGSQSTRWAELLASTGRQLLAREAARHGLTCQAYVATRNSGYARVHADSYITPLWCWQLLHDAEPWAARAWDCCPPASQFDFLEMTRLPAADIATNSTIQAQARFA